MNSSPRGTSARFYFYLVLLVIGLAGLIPATTIISSSRSLSDGEKAAVDRLDQRDGLAVARPERVAPANTGVQDRGSCIG
jgi:hypothetical protein